MVIALAAAAPSRGDDAAEAERAKVTEVRLVGVPASLETDLLAGLALAPRGGFLARKKAAFTPNAMDEDRQRILLFLAHQGYPDAGVVPQSAPDDDGEGLVVTFTITPGDPITYGTVRVDGLPDRPAGGRRGAGARRVAGREALRPTRPSPACRATSSSCSSARPIPRPSST